MNYLVACLLLAQLILFPLRAAPLSLPHSYHSYQASVDFQDILRTKVRGLMHEKFAHRLRPWRRALAPSQPAQYTTTVPPPASPKLVFAHFIVGNTYPYEVSDWTRDILLASSRGIDAFALNIGSDSWQRQRVADAYAAAQSSNTNFKLFLSFDMTVLPCSSAIDADFLWYYINTYAMHPNQQLYQSKILVSTFAGEHCTFGQSDLEQAWSFAVKSKKTPPVHFVPSFFVDPKTFPRMTEVDGQFNWNSGWPPGASNLTFSSDSEYLTNLQGKTYMAAVSPWFFTHYSPQTYNKNWIYRPDDWLWTSRWDTLIANRNVIDLVQVISWNDYGESHYIGPIAGAQPNSQAWVSGMDHQPWNDIMTYYIHAFKTGIYPDVERDRIFMWARLWPKHAEASDDAVGRPTRWQDTEDAAWGIVFATAPSRVTLRCNTTSVETSVPSGVSSLKLPLVTPGQITASMVRSSEYGDRDETVIHFSPNGFEFKLNPRTYNFNALVVASP